MKIISRCMLCIFWGAVVVRAAGDGSGLATTTPKKGAIVEISFPLQHALGLDGEFVDAGVFSARANYDRAGTGAVRLSHIKLSRREFDDAETARFKQLVTSDGVYRVQLPANTINPEEGGQVMTWLPVRCLVDSGLQESFVLHMDEAGHVLSVEYGQPGGGCRTRGDGLAQAPAVVALRSSASAKFAKDAPRLAFGPVRVTPDFVDDPAFGTDAQAAEGEDAEQKPKSVFERYWFIIVPLMLTNIMSAMAGGAKEQPAPAKKTN